MWRMRKRDAVLQAMRQRARYHENYGGHGRLFHTVKALICMALGRRGSLWAEMECYDSVAMWDRTNHHYPGCECGGRGCDWTELVVGYGWGNWHYDLYRNSSC